MATKSEAPKKALPKGLPKNYSGKVYNGETNDRGKKTFDKFIDGKFVEST